MYTDTFEIIDKRFKRYALGNVHMETLYEGSRWAEGPAYFAAGKYLLWSDIPNDRILRYDETSGAVSVFQHPAATITATRSTVRAGSFPANIAAAASPVSKSTDRPPNS